MTMHLLPIYYTTTSTQKRKKKKTKSLIAAEIHHEKYLRKMGIHSDQRKETQSKFINGNKCYGSTASSNIARVSSNPTLPAKIVYDKSMAKPAPKVYTGTEITGIAVMHKSNAVPIRGKEQAIEIARMRRG